MTTPVDARRSGRKTIVSLIAAVAGYRYLIWHFHMRFVDKSGDEGFFFSRAQVLRQWTKGAIEFDTMMDRLVAKGWFMPGMAIHTWPARTWFTEGTLELDEIARVRLFLGSMDFVLLLVAAFFVGRLFGRRIGVAFFAFVGFFPDAAYASFSLWGEAHGSKIVLLALLGLTALARRSARFGPSQLLFAGVVGVIFAWSIYVRPPFLLQLGTAFVVLIVVAAGRTVERPKVSVLLAACIIPLVGIALLLPWSNEISERNGAFVLTTNTIDVNLIHAFSNPEDLEALTGGVEFPDIHNYALAQSAETGVGYAVVLQEMREELLSNITFGHYLSSADREVTRFYREDETFLNKYEGLVRRNDDAPDPTGAFDWIRLANDVMWYPLAAVTVLAMFWRFPMTAFGAFPAITGKIAISALTIQPWVSNAKFRHLGAIIPTMVLFALLVLAHAGRDLLTLFPADDHETALESEARQWMPWSRRMSVFIQLVAATMTLLATLVYLT